MEPYIQQIVTASIGLAVGGVSGFLVGFFKRMTKIEKAKATILKASARRNIKNDYQRYIVEKHVMTIDSYDNLIEEFEAYKTLGGNGTAEKYMGALMELNPYLVTD